MGSEAACHFSEDDGGAERSLAAIIGIGHVASGDESEQVVAVASHGAEELAGGLVFRRFGEETVEPAVEIGAILLEVVSWRVSRRRPMATARFKRALKPGAKTVSPSSMAYWASRRRWARQICRSSPWPF